MNNNVLLFFKDLSRNKFCIQILVNVKKKNCCSVVLALKEMIIKIFKLFHYI